MIAITKCFVNADDSHEEYVPPIAKIDIFELSDIVLGSEEHTEPDPFSLDRFDW